jgi:starch-binding outer membrane protein, SusD/RagB family
VSSVSCKKEFLEDMKSYNQIDESMFGNEVLTGYYIDRVYNYYFASYRNPMQTVVGLYDDTRRNLTEEVGGTVGNYINPSKTLIFAADADGYYQGTGSTLPSSVSNNPYTRIRNANFLIQRIDEVGKDLPQDFRNKAKGQMYFFRGLQYFDLVRVYGGVPLVLTVQNASATDESIRLPRAKSSEVFEQIAKDFDSAAALLPQVWTSISTDYGRFTSGAALAMKSRVLLTAASPLFNTDWDNAGNEKWQKALAAGLAAETALMAANYGTTITSAKDWAEAPYKFDKGGDGTTPLQGEGIFVIPLSSSTASSGVINSSWENSIRTKDQNGGGGISAPKGMIDLFPMEDGTRPTAANGYDETFFFAKRDPRFYRTFAFSGSKWPYKANQNYVTWLYRWKKDAAATSGTFYGSNSVSSPAVVRKMSNPNADNTGFAFSGTDILDYRYGELLLNIAECYAATGDNDKCVEYLGKIRKRVGIPEGANKWGIGTLTSRYAALEACLYERRVELAYEGKRFWDLQRWMLYDDEGTDNTNSKLGIPKLNGTNRTGYYWQSKTYNADPLTAADRASISIDPDASDFKTQIDKLKILFTNKFEIAPLDNPMDREGTVPVNILFRSNYYLSGIQGGVLANNPWLMQTKGWQDYNGAMGTFDYQQ